MNEYDLAKIQNTIRELENELSKVFIDNSVSQLLMKRSVNQFNDLLQYIGFLEAKLQSNIQSNEMLSELLQSYINKFGDQIVE